MFRTVFPVLLLATLAYLETGIAAADDPKPLRAITTLGDHRLFDGKLTVKVFEKDGKLTFRITRIGRWNTGTISPATDVKKDGAAWVFVADSPDSFWGYWDGRLVKWEFEDTDDGGKSTSTVVTGRAILKQAPRAVLDNLPRELLDKLKSK
jgi:hypothetical protein